MDTKNQKTKHVFLTVSEQSDLVERIKKGVLSSEDQALVIGLIEFNGWLQEGIREKNITINKLQRLFGSKTEKNNKKSSKSSSKKATDGCDSPSESTDVKDSTTETATGMDSSESKEPTEGDSEIKNCINRNSRNHGRNSHEVYKDFDLIKINSKYKAGDPCPADCGGKLKPVEPNMVVRIEAGSMADVKKYELETLRCNKCDLYMDAKLPEAAGNEKYTQKFKAQLCLYKFLLAVPYYRLEKYHEWIGNPLPDSTQFDKVEEVANAIHPIYKHLEQLAANSNLIHADDTRVVIQSLIRQNKEPDYQNSKGQFTTGIVAYYEGQKVHIFYSGRAHAGDNIKKLLSKRAKGLAPPKYMCDALASNMPKALELVAIIMNCLVHGRRNFFEIKKYYPEACSFVLDIFSKVYKNEAEIKGQGLGALDRLKHHQQHSGPIMDQLLGWVNQQLDEKFIEKNSTLGKACQYLRNHWERLTKFLRIEGAPLDNNVVEQALKLQILVRKNSLFYVSDASARISNILLSVIHTCLSSNQNPLDYLTQLQVFRSEMLCAPEKYMPWNYLETIQESNLQIAA